MLFREWKCAWYTKFIIGRVIYVIKLNMRNHVNLKVKTIINESKQFFRIAHIMNIVECSVFFCYCWNLINRENFQKWSTVRANFHPVICLIISGEWNVSFFLMPKHIMVSFCFNWKQITILSEKDIWHLLKYFSNRKKPYIQYIQIFDLITCNIVQNIQKKNYEDFFYWTYIPYAYIVQAFGIVMVLIFHSLQFYDEKKFTCKKW